jgi:putative RNA 2'-phosphotransferase
MDAKLKTVSKLLSLVLRHEPTRIGLTLDANGWADVDDLVARVRAHGPSIDRDLLTRVVTENDKQRFAFSDDRQRIRANQGHSIVVDLALEPKTPPLILFHGTSIGAIASIRAQGLLAGNRQHVHLSSDTATATKVGARHGKAVVLTVLAADMHAAGHPFYVSANGVWLTDHVPPLHLRFPA